MSATLEGKIRQKWKVNLKIELKNASKQTNGSKVDWEKRVTKTEEQQSLNIKPHKLWRRSFIVCVTCKK